MVLGVSMFKQSFYTYHAGFALIMIASAMFYFGIRSYLAYGLFALGFILIGVGILLGLFKMMADK